MFSKISKKIVAVTLAAAVAFTSAVVASPTDASAAKAKFNKKSVTMTVGGKDVKLKASGKATGWKSSNKKIASVKGKGKTGTVTALSKGTCNITAKVNGTTITCKVKVNPAKSGTVIYDLAKEHGSNPENGDSYAAPVKCPYSEFKYSSFRIWLCQAILYDPAKNGKDYRGKKLNISVTVKNSGKNDLAELGFCFNNTSPVAYPFAFHAIDSKLRASIAKKANKKWSLASVKKDKTHKGCTVKEMKIKKGKTYTFNFSYTIPANAMNGDKDPDTGLNYPIMFYIPNLKDNCPYKVGDEVTVLKCKISVA